MNPVFLQNFQDLHLNTNINYVSLKPSQPTSQHVWQLLSQIRVYDVLLQCLVSFKKKINSAFISASPSQSGNAHLSLNATDLIRPHSFLFTPDLSGSCIFRKQEYDYRACLVFTSRKVGLCSSFSSVQYSWGAVQHAAAVCK